MKYRIAALLVLLSLYACDRKDKSIQTISNDLGTYIAAHTSGGVNASDDVYIQLAQEVQEEIALQNAISITPGTDVDVILQDNLTVVIRPKTKWDYDQHYVVKADLKALTGVAAAPKDASFSFMVEPITLTMEINPAEYSGSKASVSGAISSTDPVDNKLVESMIKSNEGSIAWTHYSPTQHGFTITDLNRKGSSWPLSLSWNGQKVDKNFSGKETINILSENEFVVVESIIDPSGNALEVTFSDKLDPNQKLDGLITVEGLDGKYRYDIESNRVKVYPPKNPKGVYNLMVDKNITRADGKRLQEAYASIMSIDPTLPELKLSGKGVIVPFSNEVIFPFEAQNLKGAVVEIFKIYQDNVLQYLQYNKLSSQYGLEPVGRIVHQEHIDLSQYSVEDNSNGFVRYALDLSKFTSLDPGSIYQVRIGFHPNDVKDYPCAEVNQVASAYTESGEDFKSIMQMDYTNYDWSERKNPCHSSFYQPSKYISRNVLASNLGIIAKVSPSHEVTLTVSDLRTVEPIHGAEVTYYDFQRRDLGKSTVGSDGIVSTVLDRKPSFAIVDYQGEFGYVSLNDNEALSLSEYNVSGYSKKGGIDGFLYGERGVWRPGDTIYLDFMLEDRDKRLPASHPISISVKDARGKERYKETTTSHQGGLYGFSIPTEASAPTGNWMATVKVGGKSFQKSLSVETVKPNRIKLDYFQDYIDLSEKTSVPIEAKWLHGAPAAGLKTEVELSLVSIPTSFPSYGGYVFDDPARKVSAQPVRIFDESLDENGKASINLKPRSGWKPPGKVKARLKSKVVEKGGDFSIDNYSVDADIYGAYVGLDFPENNWGSPYHDQTNPKAISIVAVDKDGRPLANRKVIIGLYKAEWSWWYDRNYNQRYNYNSSTHLGSIEKKTVTTDAQGKVNWTPDLAGYGNYMVRVCDDKSRHCTGTLFYTGTYSSSADSQGPTLLTFATDKKSYTLGESIEVNIPSNKGSKIYVSLENGKQVLRSWWVDGDDNRTKISIPTTAEMNSNIYIHASLVQPHNNGENDLPMRMYGVVPVSVIDSNTQLTPEIVMPDVLKPNEDYTVKVTEEKGRAMYYTLAIVDEGLLSLTRHKTPSPWDRFYGKQALGVKTWDIYDYVLDGYGGDIDRYISVGGDATTATIDNATKVNRFDPVVTHLGPFYLEKNGTATHTLDMPNYVGAVRAMVVARYEDRYGHNEKQALVKKPLMVQTTLPRVLGPNETITMPANVWAMEDRIKQVSVDAEVGSNMLLSNPQQSLAFARQGDQQAYFNIQVGNKTGPTQIKVEAKSGNERSYETTHINVRNPNPITSEVVSKTLQPGEIWEGTYQTFGTSGTNEVMLELSNIPPLNFGKRLKYLMQYPYGCLEQTTSSVFPQLYLSEITDMSPVQSTRVKQNVTAGIRRLELFQQSSGGFSYWQGNTDVSEWSTSYAGHFLIAAKNKGYAVPSKVIRQFVQYQNTAANTSKSMNLQQAYRLYTLALAGKPNISAMNRMRRAEKLSNTSKYMLGASYALIGQKEAAKELIYNLSTAPGKYATYDDTYGSEVRDMAIIALAQHTMGDQEAAINSVQQLSRELNNDKWYSTQSTAYALLAIGEIYGKSKGELLTFDYSIPGDSKQIQSEKSLYQRSIDATQTPMGKFSVKNTGQSVLFAKMILNGQRAPGSEEKVADKHVALSVSYADLDGKPLDPKAIKQGTDFYVTTRVTNPGTKMQTINEMVLSQIFPSGWEIHNDRLGGGNNSTSVEYQDIRDDRIYSFFDLKKGKPLTLKQRVTATYAGRFYMPQVVAKSMYDNDIQSSTAGSWVEVIR